MLPLFNFFPYLKPHYILTPSKQSFSKHQNSCITAVYYLLTSAGLHHHQPYDAPGAWITWIYLYFIKAIFFTHRSHCRDTNPGAIIRSASAIHTKMAATTFVTSWDGGAFPPSGLREIECESTYQSLRTCS